MSKVLKEIDKGICRITINRPEVLNTLDYETLALLQEKLAEVHIDSSVQVVVFTGAGPKAFSAGADLKERKTLNHEQVARNVKLISDVFNQVAELPQVTIAKINGYTFGGGFELMLACDFAICSDNSKFGLTEASWGIIPGAGGTQRLPRAVGLMKAKELILTARRFEPEEALDLGLVLEVVAQEELDQACQTLTDRIIENAPLSLTQAKFAMNYGTEVDLQTGLKIEQEAYRATIDTEDRMEALNAFNEKRKPVFKGK